MSANENAAYNSGRQIIFAVLFALYVIEHHFYQYRGFFGDLPSYFVLSAAILLLIFPRNYGLFFAIAMGHLALSLSHLPTGSNHNLLSLFVTFGLAATYIQIAISQRRLVVNPSQHFDLFVPIGRWTLLIMYFFGTFHKINTDFLNPTSSCAVFFWHRYGFPEIIARSPIAHSLAMYGTLVLEATIIAMLLSRRFRWWGIVLGVCFHAFLALQPDGWFRAFSVLSIALHSLFLPPDALSRFTNGKVGRALIEFFVPIGRRILYGIVILAAWVLAWNFLPRPAEWLFIIALFLLFVVAYCREPAKAATPAIQWLRSPSIVVNLLVLAFFLNGLSPYFGFKTGQSIAMFSNLVTEAQRSNHLFMPNIPLFDYQDRVATIIESDHPSLLAAKNSGRKLVEYHVLDALNRRPDFEASYQVNGEMFTHSPEQPLATVSNLAPQWLRSFIVFRPVSLASPRGCDDL